MNWKFIIDTHSSIFGQHTYMLELRHIIDVTNLDAHYKVEKSCFGADGPQ